MIRNTYLPGTPKIYSPFSLFDHQRLKSETIETPKEKVIVSGFTLRRVTHSVRPVGPIRWQWQGFQLQSSWTSCERSWRAVDPCAWGVSLGIEVAESCGLGGRDQVFGIRHLFGKGAGRSL